jgi:hypothetical protein
VAFGGAQVAVFPDGKRFVARRSLPGEGRRSMKLMLNWQSALGR